MATKIHSRSHVFNFFRIRVGTFNVNGKNPTQSIESWVRGSQNNNETRSDKGSDIYIFGFQELDQSAAALLYSTSNMLETEWSEAILKVFGKEASYYTKVRKSFVNPY